MPSDYFKHLLIRTPFEPAARAMRRVGSLRKRLAHPELRAIYEEDAWIGRALAQLLERDDNCIDVGCHLGSMLSLFLRRAPNGQHTAFEPVPGKAEWLRRKFPEVDVREVALADEPGEVEFFVNRTQTGFSGLSPHSNPGDDLHKITVTRSRLDDELDRERPVRLMKVDVEGGELGVLRGARETLARWRPALVFESTRTALASAGLEPHHMHEYVVGELGYSIRRPIDFVCGEPALDLERFVAAHEYPFQAFNFVAVAD